MGAYQGCFPSLHKSQVARVDLKTFSGMAGAASSSSSREDSGSFWSSSTNWSEDQGSLLCSVTAETSADDAPAGILSGVLLSKPLSEDSEPCEITVSFKGTYNVHRVYVRSTARNYELYITTAQPSNSREYLCTVHCGAVAESRSVAGTTESVISGPAVQRDSNSSDEDGWVEVKVRPVSTIQDDQADTLSGGIVGTNNTNQMHYEATAEITDASPCVSLTLRLLSLRTIACVHIEEIYIYADPVEELMVPDPSHGGGRESSRESSLLAMLVPSLLQFSKAASPRIHNRVSLSDYSDDVQFDQHSAYIAAETARSLDSMSALRRDERSGIAQETPDVHTGNRDLEPVQKEPSSQQGPLAATAENGRVSDRIEKVLDELVSRMGRIEAFCSRFEQNMTKPLSNIESRLHRLEQRFDAFFVGTQPSDRILCSKISAPEYSSEESDSEDRGCDTVYKEREDGALHDPSPADDDMVVSSPGSPICTDLSVKPPENFNEGGECMGTNDILDPSSKGQPANNKPFSIDGAMSLELKSFLTSTTSIRSPSQCQSSIKSSNSTNSCLASSTVRDSSAGDYYFLSKSYREDNGSSAVGGVERMTTHFTKPLSSVGDMATSEVLFGGIDPNIDDEEHIIFDVGKGIVVGDYSTSLINVVSPVFDSCPTAPQLIVIAPEFLDADADLMGCGATSDSHVTDCEEDIATSPTAACGGSGSTSASASSLAKSSIFCPTMQDGSSELSTDENNMLTAAASVSASGRYSNSVSGQCRSIENWPKPNDNATKSVSEEDLCTNYQGINHKWLSLGGQYDGIDLIEKPNFDANLIDIEQSDYESRLAYHASIEINMKATGDDDEGHGHLLDVECPTMLTEPFELIEARVGGSSMQQQFSSLI